MFSFFRQRKPSEFESYLPSAKELREMVAGSGDKSIVISLERKNIHFLLVAVGGMSEAEIGRRLAAVTWIASELRWHTCVASSNFAVMVESSTAFKAGPLEIPAAQVVQRLQEEFGQECKSLGGEQVMAWGDYGGARRVFGPLFPDFLQLVAALERQPFDRHERVAAR